MKMLHTFVLVKPLTKEQLGTIVLPSTVEDEWERGKVIGIGDKSDSGIKVDDIVLYPAGVHQIGRSYPTVGNQGNIIIPENYIWAIED